MSTELFQGHAASRLRVTFDQVRGQTCLVWERAPTAHKPLARVVIIPAARQALKWELHQRGHTEEFQCALTAAGIRGVLTQLQKRFPVPEQAIVFETRVPDVSSPVGGGFVEPIEPWDIPWRFLQREILRMGQQLQGSFGPLTTILKQADPEAVRFFSRQVRREAQRAQQQAELEARVRAMRRKRAERARRQQENRARSEREKPTPAPGRPVLPLPPAAVRIEPPQCDDALLSGIVADTFPSERGLRDYLLAERAARWWVSNQSDDLLCLPYCAIKHLDYQIRTALRVIGPLRGRALLSDEVGLGKTIEAGLVLKEYLTRGMVKRFLVLTLPSLVDQWAEELESKFNITVVTTNQPAFRSASAGFWKDSPAIVASIHTLKQEANLAHARAIAWDMLIVDEAHYLRNRAAQTWQAVNVLPRQFLLLLTATPVQNSIEEVYNLVTLLKPGQLPSPREFHARFASKERPLQPRNPEELRRLLGQVMIRNTRANAGITLPSRRAETALFEPTGSERAFWEAWDQELREVLETFDVRQSSLWGRLLLQAAGSSPRAWRAALASFPDAARAERWRQSAPLEESWHKKVALLPPLARTDGGLVVFTQFLETQAALAEALGAGRVRTWAISGQTPAAQRQPITDQFRAEGGVLLLTHSGTEGRNLQFCHRLVNFDLPWNPMEIEQRIGRLHRIGQQQPVEIYNLVQAGTLQAHLLDILQEKLNLFELVVGETGLILGERFSSDDFAEEVFRRWRDSGGMVAAAMHSLGDELQTARAEFEEVKRLDEVLFERDYETT